MVIGNILNCCGRWLGNKMSDKELNKESIFTMLASEEVLRSDWDNELDERWNNV